MKIRHLMILVAGAGLFGGCAATIPQELASAREAYRQASTGPTAQIAPAELHVAGQALAKAEQSFKDDPESFRTRDLAYVAQRKCEMAEATASILTEQKVQARSKDDFQATQGRIIAEKRQDLSNANSALAESQRSGEMTAEKLAVEQAARVAAEKRAAEALEALAKLAAVKEETRGLVITLSGSVLFASNQATLLPAARARLDQVADVLLTTRERNLVVEGHTDSQGSDTFNMDLSQRRADAVRNYIVQRGYGADLIQAHGLGEGRPIADNTSAEGRANNRRVEIIIQRAAQAVR
jgi:outer membrane protein OmpA-like peptidoglycan-associated protein